MTVQIQLRTMDHSARRSMKNAANCVKYGELQGSRNRNVSNAYGTLSSPCWGYVCLRVCWTDNDHLVNRRSTSIRDLEFTSVTGCFPFDIRCLTRERTLVSLLVPPMSEIRYRVLAGAKGPGIMGLSIAEYKSAVKRGEWFFSLLTSISGPQIRRGYPPNLSISFSGGKETKEDSPSNGERTGTSPAPNFPSLGGETCGVWERHFSGYAEFRKSVGTRPFPVEGDRPVSELGWSVGVSLESTCL